MIDVRVGVGWIKKNRRINEKSLIIIEISWNMGYI